MSDLIIAVLSIVVGSVVSVMITRMYYRRGGLAWFVKDFELLDFKAFNVGNRLALTGDGDAVKNLHWSTVVFWNSGTVAHTSSSIAPADSLRVTLTAPAFRQILKIEQSRRAVNAKIVESVEGFAVQFDILDENDWVIAYVLYDAGTDAANNKPEFKGTLMNLPNGFKLVDLEVYFTEMLWNRRLLAIMITIIPVMLGILLIKLFQLLEEIKATLKTDELGLDTLSWIGVIPVALAGLGSVAYLSSRWMVTSTRVPKRLLKALPMQKSYWFER